MGCWSLCFAFTIIKSISMEVILISVGDLPYSKYSIPLIQSLCDYNQVKLHVITADLPQNINRSHPAWLKLFCHDICDSDFVIVWDCDLVPTRLYNLYDYFDMTKINMAYDGMYIRTGNFFNHKFKYNSGLIGIPKTYSQQVQQIYYKYSKDSTYPSWEQYHLNDTIYDENWPIHVLDNVINCMDYMNYVNPNSTANALNLHYTSHWVDGVEIKIDRTKMIKDHYDKYLSNFKF